MLSMTNPHCTRLIEVAHRLMDALPDSDVVAAFLFGSAAWGDADAASDLDLMLLLDRPAGYREGTRVRLADMLAEPLPNGPVFADLDRISAEGFAGIVADGGAGARVARSIVLKDTDGFYRRIRERVHAEYFSPEARAARFLKRREQAEEHLAAARRAEREDGDLAALHSRLALEGAGAALIELNDDRQSVTHYVESVGRALSALGAGHLSGPFLRMLSLDAPVEGAELSRGAYDAFAGALRAWVADPAVGGRLSAEDLAWAEFTYGAQTYEEIGHKAAAFRALGRIPALLYYLDGQMMVPIRINVGKVFLLRSTGAPGRMPIPEFQLALKDEPALYGEWVSALRLGGLRGRSSEAEELVRGLVRAGDAAIAAGGSARAADGSGEGGHVGDHRS